MTRQEFIATRQAVPNVRAALLPVGFDYGEETAIPGFIYDGDCYIFGTESGECVTHWCSDEFRGTLAECEAWLYECLEGEGLV